MSTAFQEKVYTLCRKVPRGRVTTYKAIGDALGGRGQVYRAVGAALNRNPYAPEVPCHRVIAGDGSVGGFAHGVKKKTALLQKEGVRVRKGKVVGFRERLFLFRAPAHHTKKRNHSAF